MLDCDWSSDVCSSDLVEVIYFCERCREALLAKPPLPPGYRQVFELGRGRTGAVYRATHPALGDCALRLILPRVAIPRAASQAMLPELSRSASLQHRHLLAVLEFGEVAPGILWMSTELLPDRLTELARRSPQGMEARHVSAIGLQLLDAVAHVHRNHALHGAISASKVLITRDQAGLKIIKLGGSRWVAAFYEDGERDRRFQTAAELGLALRAVLDGPRAHPAAESPAAPSTPSAPTLVVHS
jgi:serine/threonine protein kinase